MPIKRAYQQVPAGSEAYEPEDSAEDEPSTIGAPQPKQARRDGAGGQQQQPWLSTGSGEPRQGGDVDPAAQPPQEGVVRPRRAAAAVASEHIRQDAATAGRLRAAWQRDCAGSGDRNGREDTSDSWGGTLSSGSDGSRNDGSDVSGAEEEQGVEDGAPAPVGALWQKVSPRAPAPSVAFMCQQVTSIYRELSTCPAAATNTACLFN